MESEKRRRMTDEHAISRGVSISAAARIGFRFEQNPELLTQSQHPAAVRKRELKAHRMMWEELGFQEIDLKCKDGSTLKWSFPNLGKVV